MVTKTSTAACTEKNTSLNSTGIKPRGCDDRYSFCKGEEKSIERNRMRKIDLNEICNTISITNLYGRKVIHSAIE